MVKRPSRASRLLALAAALALGGCSLTLRGPSPDTPPEVYPDCSDDVTLPTIDLSVGVLFALTGLTAAVSVGSADESFALANLATGLGAMALFGGAAFRGFVVARRCDAARNEYRARYEQQQQQQQRQQQGHELGPPSLQPAGPPSGP